MRYLIVARIYELFSNGRNADVLNKRYAVDDKRTYEVKDITTNTRILTDEELVDFYTYCVILCYRQR